LKKKLASSSSSHSLPSSTLCLSSGEFSMLCAPEFPSPSSPSFSKTSSMMVSVGTWRVSLPMPFVIPLSSFSTYRSQCLYVAPSPTARCCWPLPTKALPFGRRMCGLFYVRTLHGSTRTSRASSQPHLSGTARTSSKPLGRRSHSLSITELPSLPASYLASSRAG